MWVWMVWRSRMSVSASAPHEFGRLEGARVHNRFGRVDCQPHGTTAAGNTAAKRHDVAVARVDLDDIVVKKRCVQDGGRHRGEGVREGLVRPFLKKKN